MKHVHNLKVHVLFLQSLEHAHKRNAGETNEVGSVSKKTMSSKGPSKGPSKGASTSQKKDTNVGAASESGLSSIKKRLEYMQDKPIKKISKKGVAEPEISTNIAGITLLSIFRQNMC